MLHRPEDHLYTLQEGPDFDTGFCADGTQVLFCPCYYHEVLGFFFDGAGRLVHQEQRKVEEDGSRGGDASPDCPATQLLLKQWKDEVRFRPGTIKVRRFFNEALFVGIDDGLDMFEDHEAIPEAEREYNRESRAGWLESGCFVFYFGRDYHVSGDGEVMST